MIFATGHQSHQSELKQIGSAEADFARLATIRQMSETAAHRPPMEGILVLLWSSMERLKPSRILVEFFAVFCRVRVQSYQ